MLQDVVDSRLRSRVSCRRSGPADQRTAALRRKVTRRAGLITERTRCKNRINAALVRNLTPRQPISDLVGRGGLTWLAQQQLPADERQAVDASLRQVSFLDEEIGRLDCALAVAVLDSAQMQRLFTLPGVNAVPPPPSWCGFRLKPITRFAPIRSAVSEFSITR